MPVQRHSPVRLGAPGAKRCLNASRINVADASEGRHKIASKHRYVAARLRHGHPNATGLLSH